MKYAVLALGFLLLGQAPVFAACSGGLDGSDRTLSGCSEIGALGDLIYERDQTGRVMRKRDDAEIKQYLMKTVEDRLKKRGISMKNKDGQPVIKINQENVVFDLFNQNGDKIFTYTVDMEKGVPQNEKDVIESREVYDQQKAKGKAERKGRIEKIQAMAEKIKAEEIEKKAAAKK